MTPIITLQQLIDALPTPALKEWGATYGPPLLTLGLDELKSLMAMLIAGDTEAPLRAALAAMTPEQKDADCLAFTQKDDADAQANADSVAAQMKAAQVLASIVLAILLSLVGL